ncbi:MAG: amidohydrolase family protein [Promethearchaeota archaeon]
MDIIDSHVHLYPEPNLDKELNILEEEVNPFLIQLSNLIKTNNILYAVVYVLDKNVLYYNFDLPKNLIISCTLGINDTYKKDIEQAYNKDIKIIKILPYEQEITKKKYSNILEIAQYAEEKRMILTICSTYGSKLIYDVNGIKLAVFLKKKFDIPIILAHGGATKVLDAMSIALDYDNIYLDLSFSLKYWWGSSILKDYAFALKKLNCDRIFYGSDYPYVDFDISMKTFLDFIKKYDFSEDNKEKLAFKNFNKFKRDLL